MRYTARRKDFLPSLHSGELEDYLIAEMKRRIVFDMIDKLPFEVFESQTYGGTKYKVCLDVAIEGWDEFSKRIAPFHDGDKTMQNL